MATFNNVNVGMLEQLIKEAETDKSKVMRSQKVDGEWLLQAVKLTTALVT